MITNRCMTLLFVSTLVLLCSCSDNSREVPSQQEGNASLPGLVRPVLSGMNAYERGADIKVRVIYPASDWQIEGDLQKAIEAGDRKPWHIRVNSKDFCLDRMSRYSQWFPPEKSMITQISRELVLNRDSSDQSLEWKPGEYRVAFVFKDITVCHAADPEQQIHYEEWASNEISFQIVNRSEENAPADAKRPRR